MIVYIKSIKKDRELYLYDKDENDITERFFDMFVELDDTLKLNDEERQSFGTEAKYLLSNDIVYNAWCEVIDRQQKLLDKCSDEGLESEYEAILNLKED